MASNRHATPQINHMFICILVSLLLPTIHEGTARAYDSSRSYLNDDGGRRLTREYNLRQGALRGLIVKPSRLYDLQPVEMFLGIPYAAPPIGSLRFMPPVSAPPWSGLKNATEFAPVCPQSLPSIKKDNPPSLGRQHYMSRLKPFLKKESEDCLYLNIYVPYREEKSKKFPVLVFVHGDSFEWSSGNPYDGRILSSYGNIMVITLNFRLGILGFMKPSITEHEYGNNGLLDQLAALQWIKDNIEDLNGDPRSVTLMGHGTGAACINFLMLSPISNGLFHRAILMSGSALSDWAMTKDPTQYTLQVAQSLGCNPNLKDMMKCMQNKPLSEIKKVQILAREFESPLAPVVAGSFIPNEPANTMESFPKLLSKYQVLSGVTELESYHDFSVIELDHGILETQRDDFINKLSKILFGGAEDIALKEILKQYSPIRLDPQRWNVETNRDVILNLFSDARTLAPMIRFTKYHSEANRQSYFYVFGHNSISTEYAPLNKSVNGEELPYVLGIPLGGANTHFHSEYTQKEKLLSEVVMRLWTNFVKIGTPNTQKVNKYHTLDEKQWSHYNVEWPEYNDDHQSYLKLDIPPFISSFYRSNFSKFWIESLPNKMSKYIIDPLFEYTPSPTTQKYKLAHRELDSVRKIFVPRVVEPPRYISSPSYGKVKPYSPPNSKLDTDHLYREIQSIKSPTRPRPPELLEKTILRTVTNKPKSSSNYIAVSKTTSATVTLIVCLSILFVIINIGICIGLYIKRRKSHLRNNFNENSHSRPEIGDVDLIGQKTKEDKSALQSFKNGCSAIKSISLNKVRGGSIKNIKRKLEPCKTPKSDDSGGFRERFQLRRHLSTSTLDAHTKVRDWIANEVMHRCSPNILRKSNLDLNSDKKIGTGKIYTRSEEILSNTKVKNDVATLNSSSLSSQKKYSSDRKRNSEKTASTSALGSHSSIGSNKHSLSRIQTKKSSDSLKSKGTDSTKSKKVSVAIDATPAARTNSILKQEPIELSKSLDNSEYQHSKSEYALKRSKTEGNFDQTDGKAKSDTTDKQMFTNIVTMSLQQNQSPLRIIHKHSTSDPVTDVNYDKLMKEKMENTIEDTNILPPVTFRNDINVTSQDENERSQPLTSAEALLTIKRRNFPKVLPDFPKTQKRLSLQPSSLHTFRSFSGSSENSERSKVPPQPPPRTTTLERRFDYANSKALSSFDVPKQNILTSESFSRNYENMDALTHQLYVNNSFETHTHAKQLVINDPTELSQVKEREYPKVIIASSDTPSSTETKILIKPTSSQVELKSNIPRVRLPDDFHSQTTGSTTSFSSIYSDDDINDVEDDDDIAEDKLLQELVGGVESPTNLDIIFDSKGPETIYEKKLEIVPVKVNPGFFSPKSSEDYVCISNLLLPDVSGLEKTAQIKPNIGLNKLQEKSESIQRPREKAVKLKQKKGIRPGDILGIASKNRKRNKLSFESCDIIKLEHSNSGSSNDTETSTGTVKKVEIRHS